MPTERSSSKRCRKLLTIYIIGLISSLINSCLTHRLIKYLLSASLVSVLCYGHYVH